MSTSAIPGSTPATQPQTVPTTSASNSNSSGGIDTMFMQLLLTQLQHQDPMSPMDPSTFVNQLAQVNSLDQLTQINQDLRQAFGIASTPGSNTGGL